VKVLYITTAYPRSESDVITPWLVETIIRLRKNGHDVRVFASSYRGLGNQVVASVPVYRFRYAPKQWEDLTHDEMAMDRMKRGVRYKLLLVAYLLRGTLAAWGLCRRERFDVIHVHWPLPHSLFGYAAARACNAPTVISFHGAELMVANNVFRLARPFLRWAIRTAGAVTANSTHTVSAIQKIHFRPVAIVPFGTAAGSCSETPIANVGQTRQLLFVGRLVERKGIPYLLEALGALARQTPVHLNIVGSGPESANLQEMARTLGVADWVTFHGKVSQEELVRQYQSCDVFVLPAIVDSRGDTEGLGVVIIEAMSHRKPVVASGVGGIVDLVVDGKTGLIAPPKDSSALAAAISRVLTDTDLATRLGQAGFEHVQRNYSWPAILSRLERIYGCLLHDKDAE
jgi:glycosyltransferase involved in cell wall biosynthesis